MGAPRVCRITNNYGHEHFKSCHDVRILPEGIDWEEPEPTQPPLNCHGEPCTETGFCRSEWGHCGSSPDHCNARSIWSPGCTERIA